MHISALELALFAVAAVLLVASRCRAAGRRSHRAAIVRASRRLTPGVLNPRRHAGDDRARRSACAAGRAPSGRRRVHVRPQAQGSARLRAARAAVRVPGGPPDQPRARRASDRPAQPVARAVPARVGGRPDRERAERRRLQRPADARGGAATRVGAQARGWLSVRGSSNFLAPSQLVLIFLRKMFYATYVRNELLRRRARTIVTLLGLGLGVALVIVIASLSNGLDRAQRETLDPLGGIGTDITVTLTPQQNQSAGFAGPGGGGGNRDLVRANQSVITDLSQLGKPGEHFVHDFFLPGSQLTFQQSAVSQITSIDGVAQVAAGLTLLARASGGRRPEDRREAEDGRPDLRHPAQPAAADSGAVPEDAGLHRQAAGQSGSPARTAAAAAARRFGGGFGGNGGPGRGAVPEVPAGEPAALPHAVHDAGADAQAGARPAADQHHDDRVHDRRRRSDEPAHGRRDRVAGDEGPLPRAGRWQGSARLAARTPRSTR